MKTIELLVPIRRRFKGKGPMSRLRTAYQRHQFVHARRAHLFKGVFPSYAAAQASAPDTAPVGYDNDGSAQLYDERLFVDDYDYPALFWISDAFQRGMSTLADVGGAIGIKYYAFSKMIAYPKTLRWTVVDVPAMADKGRKLAEERGIGNTLLFSSQLSDADGADLLYVSGALQYLEQSLPEILAGMKSKPRRIVINTTPIHEHHAFFTLNSIGTAYCPYRVEAREPFVAGVKEQGYKLRDSWLNIGKSMPVIGQPEYSVPHYSGFCFDRTD